MEDGTSSREELQSLPIERLITAGGRLAVGGRSKGDHWPGEDLKSRSLRTHVRSLYWGSRLALVDGRLWLPVLERLLVRSQLLMSVACWAENFAQEWCCLGKTLVPARPWLAVPGLYRMVLKRSFPRFGFEDCWLNCAQAMPRLNP